MGLQVENLVVNNRRKLLQIMGVYPEDVLYTGPYFQRKTNRQAGCQMDYLIQTKTNVRYVCEIKFSKNAVGLSVVR